MAESGCLHNKKYNTIEATGDIDGKDLLVESGISNPHVAGITSTSDRFVCKTLYSCGTDQGKYLNRSHYISSNLDLDKGNKLFSSSADKTVGIPYAPGNLEDMFGFANPADIEGYHFAVEGDAFGSHNEGGTGAATYYKSIYNNAFINLSDKTKNALKEPDTSNNGGGVVKFNDNPDNYDNGIADNFEYPHLLDLADNFNYYVKWPARHLLHDLIIIPNKDITFKKDSDYTDNNTEGNADLRTQEMFERELTINLIQVTEIAARPVSNIGGTFRVNLEDTNSQTADEVFKVVRPRSTVGTIASRYGTTTTETEDGKKPMRGIIHRGKYMQLNRRCPYLIREFPIMAAPLGPANGQAQPTTWGKHTPIYAIQNGQPLQIFHDTSSTDGEKRTYHQHETCRTTNKLRHGSLDSNLKFAISKEYGRESGEGSEPNTRNSDNSTLRAKKLAVDDTYIESTEFSYSHSKRRDGSQVQPHDYDPRFNALTRISTGMFNFNDPIRGCVENPFTDFDESSTNKPTLMKKGASGTFYNSSDEPQYLMLNIGQNSHYKTEYRGDSEPNAPGCNDYDNTRPANELTIGGEEITPPDSSENGTSDNEQSRRELKLRFKAIFIFKQIDDDN